MAQATKAQPVVILQGAYDSQPVSMGGCSLTRLFLDPALQGAAVQILEAVDPAGTFYPMLDDDGMPITHAITAGCVLNFTRELYDGIGWLKVRTLAGSAGSYTNQAQAAQRSLIAKGVY